MAESTAAVLAAGRSALDSGNPAAGRSGSPGSHRVEQIMGTAIGIDVRGAGLPDVVIDNVFARLRFIDARFSTYRPDSEVSRLIGGELDEADCSAELRAVLGLCEDLRRTSDGYFDIRRHRPDRRPKTQPAWSRAGRSRRPRSCSTQPTRWTSRSMPGVTS